MTSFTNIIFRFSPLGIVLLIATVYHLSNDYKYIEEESTVKLQVFRHRRAINPTTALHYCKFNQYYDQEEGRCLGVPGGGKVLHVENGRSCGVNILKPHCTSLLYYHICKRDKSILAQCASGQIFDNRLQRCAFYDSSKLTPSIIQPDDHEYYEHVKVPNCTRPGRFPVPDHCSMFYTCDTNGHRLHQSVFKCPRNTGYQANREVCAVVSDCENNDSVDSAICVPDAPDENVESLNSDGATEENVEGISEESKNDSTLKREESINSKIYDDIISTPESITDNPLSVDNDGSNDGDLDKASSLPTQSIQDISVSDTTGEMFNETPNSTESAREVHDEKDDSISPVDLQITSPPTVELDAPHSVMTPTTLTPIYSTDINSNIDSETTEQYRSNDDESVTLPNSNTEALDSYLASTISNTPDLSSINDKSLKVDEGTQDMTEAVDSYQASTISNIPEFLPISETPSKLPNSNTEALDSYSASTISSTPDLSSINDKSLKVDEGTQDMTEAVDSYQASTISNISEFPPISETPSKLPNSNTEALDSYSASTISSTPDLSSINDKSLKVDEGTQDMTEAVDSYQASTISNIPEFPPISETPSKLPNSNTEALDSYSASTISSTPDLSSINDKSLKVDEGTQDMTEAVDSYQASTISNIPEFPPISETPSKLPNSNTEALDSYSASTISSTPDLSSINDKSLKVDEGMQDMTEAVDSYQASTISNIPEFPPISETPSKLYEETQSATTEQYGNDDRIMTPPNSNAETVDQNPTPILSDISVTDSPSNDFDTITPTSASAILSPQTDINDDQYATKELFKTPPSVDSKLVDPDLLLDAPKIENDSKHIDDTLDLAPTTEPTSILEHITASMDITTITPMKQDLPEISDTDLITQNGKDSTEASPFIEQDAPITDN